ncbi:MAG: hypothetical protein V1738_04230 [Patescibacteria group bacterium]
MQARSAEVAAELAKRTLTVQDREWAKQCGDAAMKASIAAKTAANNTTGEWRKRALVAANYARDAGKVALEAARQPDYRQVGAGLARFRQHQASSVLESVANRREEKEAARRARQEERAQQCRAKKGGTGGSNKNKGK